jgi:hypothetical protein
MSDCLTLGDLRRITGEPAHVLNHALNRFGPEPAGRIGIVRVWRQDQVPAILASLQKTCARSRLPERHATVTR